jgi:hypothetical protein
MLSRIRRRLTYSNVMSTLAVVILLGSGTAYASHLVVRSSDIVNGQVKKADIANRAVTEAKLAPPEAWRRVGAPGQPGFPTNGSLCTGPDQECWMNAATHNTAAFFKDPFGVVHLRGVVRCSAEPGTCQPGGFAEVIFTLPNGYRPPARELQSTLSDGAAFRVDIDAAGAVRLGAAVNPDGWVSLDGITFRAA